MTINFHKFIKKKHRKEKNKNSYFAINSNLLKYFDNQKQSENFSGSIAQKIAKNCFYGY